MVKFLIVSEDIRKVVDLPEWQALRKDLVGTWKKTPEENVRRLREFGGDLSDPRKVRILINYLTGSGFRIGIISHPEITKYRDEVREVWKKMDPSTHWRAE
jgi:hypothetical protein